MNEMKTFFGCFGLLMIERRHKTKLNRRERERELDLESMEKSKYIRVNYCEEEANFLLSFLFFSLNKAMVFFLCLFVYSFMCVCMRLCLYGLELRIQIRCFSDDFLTF